MEQKNVTAYKLWKLSGVAQSTISDILNKDDKNPTAKTLQRLAEALGVSVDEFFKEDGDENSNETKKEETKNLDVIPEQFTDPDQARAYVKKHRIFSSDGFNADKIDDEKILEFANALLEQMKLVGYKYKK